MASSRCNISSRPGMWNKNSSGCRQQRWIKAVWCSAGVVSGKMISYQNNHSRVGVIMCKPLKRLPEIKGLSPDRIMDATEIHMMKARSQHEMKKNLTWWTLYGWEWELLSTPEYLS
ncbi:hypothetical protein ACFE04_012652 [Oxalis oulophora]